ncbi:MAG: hypothetical protein ABW026_09005 [Microvirga sp.]
MAGKNDEDDQGSTDKPVSTPNLDRLARIARDAETAVQGRQWRAHKNGLQQQDEPSEVRSLNEDQDARSQAEAAMKRMMAKAKPRR